MFRYWLQGGRITVGFLGGAQIDRFANLNTTVVGPYDKPEGAAARRRRRAGDRHVQRPEIFITMAWASARSSRTPASSPRSAMARAASRAALGLAHQGPTQLITDLCAVRARPGDQGVDGRLAPSRRHARAAGEDRAGTLRFADEVERDAGADRTELDVLRALHERTRRGPRRGGLSARELSSAMRAHADRALRRRARQGAHRRSRRGADQGADRAPRQGDWAALDEVFLRLRQPGRRGQPQRRPHGAAARGLPAAVPGVTRQPPVRLRPGRGRRPRRARSARARSTSRSPAA